MHGLLKVLYYFSQWTIGLIQNLVGACLFFMYVGKRHFVYHGAVVTVWKENGSSLGMGMFVFISENCADDWDKPYGKEEAFKRTLVHEYGHTVQSAILGPFYLLVIGIPSAYWCASSKTSEYRRKKHVSYYSFYPERWANHLGEKASGDESMGQAYIG